MTALFNVASYGNAGLMFAAAGQLPAAQPTGPNLVRWMYGGLLSLLTVNNSNLGAPVLLTYMHFSATTRFARPAGAFVQCIPTRLGPQQHVFPLSQAYPGA